MGHEADRAAGGANGGKCGIDDEGGISRVDVDDRRAVEGFGGPYLDAGLARRASTDLGKGVAEQGFEGFGLVKGQVLLVGRAQGVGDEAEKRGAFGLDMGEPVTPLAHHGLGGFDHRPRIPNAYPLWWRGYSGLPDKSNMFFEIQGHTTLVSVRMAVPIGGERKRAGRNCPARVIVASP